jgi:hypothetical protein
VIRQGLIVVLLSGAALQVARADDSRFYDLSFNAFGTAGAVHSNNDRADFVSDARQPAGAGYTHSWSVTPDSKIGAQVIATFWDRLSAAVQVVAQYQADGDYQPELSWANIKYQFTTDSYVRFGRIGMPTFLNSDSLKVGYSLPYVRMPLEIFSLLPADSNDGLDGGYRFRLGEVTTTVEGFLGRFVSDTPGHGQYDARNIRGLTFHSEYDALTLHLSYLGLNYDYSSNGFKFSSRSRQLLFSFGVNYDPGTWYLSAEWVRSSLDDNGVFHGADLFGGYHFGQITPYVGYGRTYLAEWGHVWYAPYIDQRTNTVGVRWDFARHLDLKAQWDRTVLHGGANAYFVNQQPGFNPRATVNILSLALDFMW